MCCSIFSHRLSLVSHSILINTVRTRNCDMLKNGWKLLSFYGFLVDANEGNAWETLFCHCFVRSIIFHSFHDLFRFMTATAVAVPENMKFQSFSCSISTAWNYVFFVFIFISAKTNGKKQNKNLWCSFMFEIRKISIIFIHNNEWTLIKIYLM